MNEEGFDQFSVILDQLLKLNELSFEAISNYNRSNEYIRTIEGRKDFISSLPSIVEFRSPSINLLAKIVKEFIYSFDDESTQNDIKKQIFYMFYHLPSKSPSRFHVNLRSGINPKLNGISNTIIMSKSFSNAYFFRCLYDLSIYTIYEIANLIHQYWEIDSAVSCKSTMKKYSHQMPLISLLVWFAPEIDFVNNSFFNTLCKIARKEMFSRRLPKSYNYFLENIDKYRENGKWSLYKEKMNKGENENEILKYIKLDDVESLKKFCLKNSSESKGSTNSKSKNPAKNSKTSFNCFSNLNSRIESHLFSTHWLLQYSPTPLHIAAFFGASECVEFLLSDVVDSTGIKKQDKSGLDVVDFAGIGGSDEVIMSLRRHNIDVQRAIHTSSLFHRNHLADFIIREFSMNIKDFYPEMCASNNVFAFKNNQKENSFSLENLVEITARFDSFLFIRENIFAFTKPLLENSLLVAAKFSNLRYIECLLNYVKNKNLSIPTEFDINSRNEEGQTALQIAVGLSNTEIARTIILSKNLFNFDFKVNLNVKLLDSEQSLLHTCVLLNSIEIAKILLDCDDFDVNITDNNGATPLHYASRCVNTIGTHLVVDLSIVKEEFIRKPENYIFSYGKFINLEMFQLFVRTKRVDFNVFDNYGLAPLHYVAKGGRVDYIIDLKLNRAQSFDDISSIPPSLKSYFQYTQNEINYTNNGFKNGNIKNINSANPNNSNSNEPDNTNSNNPSNSNLNDNSNNLNNFNSDNPNNSNSNLNDNSNNLNNFNSDNPNNSNSNVSNDKDLSNSDANNASIQGKILVSDVDFRIKSKREHKNLLHFSAENDRVSNCSALMTFVSDSVGERDINGRTPIQLACAAGCVDCVRYLLEFATPEAINSTDKWNKTALHISGSKGRTGCVRQLAQLENIELNRRDSQGNTALSLADNHLYYLTSQLLEFVNAEK